MTSITFAQAEFILGDLGVAKRHVSRLLETPALFYGCLPSMYGEIRDSIRRCEASLLKHALGIGPEGRTDEDNLPVDVLPDGSTILTEDCLKDFDTGLICNAVNRHEILGAAAAQLRECGKRRMATFTPASEPMAVVSKARLEALEWLAQLMPEIIGQHEYEGSQMKADVELRLSTLKAAEGGKP